MADRDASSSGSRDASVKSKLKTSMANTIAAIGALKIDDRAPAEAQLISKILVAWFRWSVLAILELMAAPVATVGPSSPTDPPKPTVMGAVNKDPHI